MKKHAILGAVVALATICSCSIGILAHEMDSHTTGIIMPIISESEPRMESNGSFTFDGVAGLWSDHFTANSTTVKVKIKATCDDGSTGKTFSLWLVNDDDYAKSARLPTYKTIKADGNYYTVSWSAKKGDGYRLKFTSNNNISGSGTVYNVSVG